MKIKINSIRVESCLIFTKKMIVGDSEYSHKAQSHAAGYYWNASRTRDVSNTV